jgi:2-dehydropantoate 2-reductase
MKYVIVGAGGIGGLQGAWMARAGCDVTFVDRWAEHIDAIQAKGMHIDGSRGIYDIPVKAASPDELDKLAPLEMVIIAVKSQDTREAVRQLLPYSTPQTAFVSMQAGENLHVVEAIVGSERTIGADPNYGGALVAPGHLEAGFPNYIWIGEMDGSFSSRLRQLQLDLMHWTPTYMTDNIRGTVWTKFVYASQIVLSALMDRSSGEAMKEIKHRRVAGALVNEAIQVADALGIRLVGFDFFDPAPYRDYGSENDDTLLFWLDHAWPRHEVFRQYGFHKYVKTGSGVRWDIVHRKRSSESTAFMEALTRAAVQAGLDMPLNQALLNIIHEIERGERSLDDGNFELMSAIIENAERDQISRKT